MTERRNRVVNIEPIPSDAHAADLAEDSEPPWAKCYAGWLRTLLTVEKGGQDIVADLAAGAWFKFIGKDHITLDKCWDTGLFLGRRFAACQKTLDAQRGSGQGDTTRKEPEGEEEA